MKNLLIAMILALPFWGVAQVDTIVTQTSFNGVVTFSSFVVDITQGGQYSGTLSNFGDQSNLYFANNTQIGDVAFDNLGQQWYIVFVGSTTLLTADVHVKAIGFTPVSAPFGVGAIGRISDQGIFPPPTHNALGISDQLRSRIDIHNGLVVSRYLQDSIGSSVIDSTRLIQDSILVYYQGGIEIGRDTVQLAGSGGASAFTDLSDTPANYTGQANKIPLVNPTEDGLIFADTAGLGGGGGSSTSFTSDIGRLPLINQKVVAYGLGANEEVANYEANDINAQKFYFSSTEEYGTGGEKGGWLANGTSGDSVFVSAPFGVIIGDSQAEGHNAGHGRLHPAGVATFDANYLDASGVPSFHLREETNMRWFNHGIGSQTSADVLARFDRDVLALTSNPGDGRGARTLQRKPIVAVIIAGINDFYNGLNVADTKANLEAMASKLSSNGIYGVFLNIPGDEINNPTQNAQIDSVNTWLANGALNPYGAVIVDYNLWWKGFDKDASNIDKGPLIQDDIHPTAVGYDSLAAYIAREAKLPKLDSLIIHTKIRASGLAGYSRPTSIRVDGLTTFAITDSIMPLAISQEMSWDSISLSILASANITGTITTGISHVEWVVSNTYAGTDLVTRREPDFPGKAADKWSGGSNIYPSVAGSVSIGVSSQYDVNTVLTLKGKGTSNVNDVAFLDYTNTLRGVIRMGTGAMKFGINKSSPAYPLHVEGTVSFDNAGTYFSATGSNTSLYGGNPVFAFQSTTASPYRQTSFSYDAGNRVFSLTPRIAPNGQNYKFVLQDTLSQFPFVFDLRTQRLGLGQTENPREEIEMTGNILLAGSNDQTTASEIIFHNRLATENYSSFRSQDVSINTRYSIPSGGASTEGMVLHNSDSDSLYWSNPIANDVVITDSGSKFDSTHVEGVIEELEDWGRNNVFFVSTTSTVNAVKGLNSIIIDGTLGPTVTISTTNLRSGDEVKVYCSGGASTLDSSSGNFIRPSIGTSEATIPIDAASYLLVWDGSNFYKMN